jgi:DNA polymerase/3'-5' exonuclease PolX
MAENTQKVAGHIAEAYDGNAANLWNDGADLDTIEKRLQELPGFGPAKASKIKYVLHYFGHRDFSDEA